MKVANAPVSEQPRSLLTRRRFLTLLAFSVPSLAVTVSLFRRDMIAGLNRYVSAKLVPRIEPQGAVGVLNERDLNVLLALADALIPDGDGPGVDRQAMREHIDRRARLDMGYYNEYRNAVTLLDKGASDYVQESISFSHLDGSDRQTVLSRALAVYDLPWGALRYLIPSFRNATRLRELVMRDIIRAFYQSAGGWAVVGYHCNYPGLGIDYFDYTEAPGERCSRSTSTSAGPLEASVVRA